MFLEIISNLHHWLNASLYLAFFAAMLWGVLSIIASPCHLGSIPLIVSFINGQGKASQRKAFVLSLSFSIGMLMTIALIGLLTGLLGRMLGDIGKWGNYSVSLVFFIFGLHLMDLLPLPFLQKSANPNIKGKGIWPAFLLGLIFGIALGPCSFAFMAPVLAIAFQSGQTDFVQSIVLISAFAIGHCLVIVLAGTFSETVFRFMNWDSKAKGTQIVRKVSGALVILAGIYFLYTTF